MEPDSLCLKCYEPLNPAQNQFACVHNHFYCAECGKTMHLTCECKEILSLKPAKKDPNATITCVGQNLLVWDCDWTGKSADFKEHFIRLHNNIEMFAQFQVSSVPFVLSTTISTATLINAFDSSFIFYYHSSEPKKMVYFMIFLLEGQTEKYVYEFMIKAPGESHCKIKYVENCFSYSDNILQMRDSERCVALTFASVRKHLHDSNIHFSYLIKKKSDKTPIPPSSSLVDATASDSKTIPKQAPYQPPNKGIMKANVVRKGSSIPTGSMAPKKVEMAADPPLICLEVTEPGNTTRPAEYSSINKFHYDQMFKSPAFCTEAIHREQLDLTQDEPCHYRIPKEVMQPYKMRDLKMYRQSYPTSSLSKPLLKK